MNIFSKTQFPKVGSSTFNLSHDTKFSMSMGDLVPMLVQECVPGDKFNIRTEQMLRLMPMVAPVMHDVNVFTHYFFVPNRIIFDGWEKFITGGEDGLSQTLPPSILLRSAGTQEAGETTINYRLADYLGLPVNPVMQQDEIEVSEQVSLLPFLAYQKIYNEYYRDQNLIESLDPVFESVTSGINQYNPEFYKLRKRAWQHDYFTSALPWAQKGAPVRLPIGTTAPIQFKDNEGTTTNIRDADGNLKPNLTGFNTDANGALRGSDNSYVDVDNSTSLEADLSEAVSATINDLRRAFSLQSWLEKNARAGSRYVEQIFSMFGVKSSDARLQRPEYLGGGMSPVMISEVLQTSETQESPQGNMAGHGLNLGANGGINKYCEEHGFIIGIVSVMPKTSYQQGIPRLWKKFDKFDYFWPDFEHIGEQAIQNRELFLSRDADRNNGTFGYIPRYSEYKYNPSTAKGYFKTSLDFWTMTRIFDPETPPVLNKDFVEANPTRRIFAVEDEDEDTLLVHMYHNIKAKRKMKYYSNPSRII